MKVTLELDDALIDAIADKVSLEEAYDWGSNPDTEGDLNAQFADAFARGMRYLLKIAVN